MLRRMISCNPAEMTPLAEMDSSNNHYVSTIYSIFANGDTSNKTKENVTNTDCRHVLNLQIGKPQSSNKGPFEIQDSDRNNAIFSCVVLYCGVCIPTSLANSEEMNPP